MTIDEIIEFLRSNSSEKYKENVKRLGIPSQNVIGVATPTLRKFAKNIPKEKTFLLELWDTNFHECKILTILAMRPADCEEKDIEKLMRGIHSWDLCDLFCKTVLIKQLNFQEKIVDWAKSDDLFYKRAAFTLIASASTHSVPPESEIEEYFELILQYSEDERALIKKAISWALRALGKIDEDSRDKAISVAQKLENQGSKTQIWITKDALKELETLVKVSGRTRLISSKSKMGGEV